MNDDRYGASKRLHDDIGKADLQLMRIIFWGAGVILVVGMAGAAGLVWLVLS